MSYPERPLGEVLNLERIPVAPADESQYVQIGIKSFGRGIFHREPVPADGLSKLRYFEVHPDRLVVSNIMAWEGAVALTGPREAGCVGSARFLSYRAVGDVNLAYLNYFFQTREGRSMLADASSGSVKRNQTLSPASFERLSIRLPGLDEQRRVAMKLDAAMGKISAYAEHRVVQLNDMQRTVDAAIAQISSVSERTAPVGDLVRSVRTLVEIDPKASYRALGMRGFGRGTIRYPAVPAPQLSKLRYFSFPSDVLVLSNIKAWEGAIGITSPGDTECVASNRFMFYAPVSPDVVDIRYLAAYFLSPAGLAQIGAASPGGADRNRTLAAERFEKIVVPVPPIGQQERVARLAQIAQQVTAAARQAENDSTATRGALLNAAFTGQL
jgi:type I restriction enzyme S subunit